MMPSFTPSFHEIGGAIEAIAQAKHQGRAVVPLIGAGLSADSGLPTIVDLVRYFAALHYYIHTAAYLPRVWKEEGKHPLDKRVADYEKKPLEFVKDFNWPDLFQLTQNLRALPDLAGPGRLDRVIADELDLLARKLYPDQVGILERAPAEHGRGRRSWLWDAVGDWKDLLRYMTDSDPDYAELLFNRFHRYRRPGLGHRFLAFLTNILRIRLFLTTTIDPLLEEALTDEGIGHQMFTLHPGRPFPAPEMLRDHLAVLKLHGDASTLLAEERGNRGNALWEREVVRRFRNAFERDGLLLVLGCSGQGRLIMSLIEEGVLRLGERTRVPPNQPAVVWLHYEEQRPPAVERLLAQHPELADTAFVTAGVKQPGLFLRQLYTALTTRYPASAIPYATHTEQPILLRRAPEFEVPARQPAAVVPLLHKRQNASGTFVLFDNLRCDNEGNPPTKLPPPRAPSASERLVEWVNDQTSEGDLVPIWIDLESQFTLPEIVGAIIDRCRLYDPLLPPSVLSLDDSPRRPDDILDEAVDRVAEALRRGRYVVAFDSFETFIWPQTAHHGIITKIRTEEARTRHRLHRLTQFLIKLGKKVCEGAALLGVSVNLPQGRHDEGVDPALVRVVVKEIKQLINECNLTVLRQLEDPGPGEEETHSGSADPWAEPQGDLKGILIAPEPEGEADELSGDKAALALLCLSCFRRTRHLVALRSLLEPLLPDVQDGSGPDGLGPGARVDRLIAGYCSKGLLVPLEGGLYWMTRPLRDTIYSRNSSHTRTDLFVDIIRGVPPKDAAPMVAQLLLLALHHDRISRYYFFETFLMSRDPNTFFEYVYHRVSSIRYLTKLALVLRCEAAKDGATRACAMVRALFAGKPDSADRYLEISQETLERMSDARSLSAEVEIRRQREIDGLRLAWRVSRDLLLALVPAEQLIGWCEWLVDDDLKRFRTQHYLDSDKSGSHRKHWEEVCSALDEPVRDRIAALRDDLYSLWVESCRNRADHANGIKVRVRQFNAWNAEHPGYIPESWKPIFGKIAGQTEIEPLSWNELVTLIGDAKVAGPPWAERFLHFLLHVAELGVGVGTDVRPFLDKLYPSIVRDRERQALLDCLRLIAESQLEQARRGRDDGAEPAEVSKALERARQAAVNGLVEVRPLLPERGDIPDNPYFTYRSRFLLARGKAAWMVPDERKYHRAYRHFELARGHIKQFSDETFLAQIDLHAADCALAHADALLQPGGTFSSAGRQAEAKYHIVDSHLRHAFDHLLRSRDVIRWKEYARLYCSYKSDRNQLRLAHLVGKRSGTAGARDAGSPNALDASRRRELVECQEAARSFTRTVRQGLLTIRRGLNLELVRPTDPNQSWQTRICAELLLTALCFGKLACDVLRPEDRQDSKPAWLAYWAWLLETVGLKNKLPQCLVSGSPAVDKIVNSLSSGTDPLAVRVGIRTGVRELLTANGRT